MPRTRLRHFLLHSVLFHIFLGVLITLSLIYIFDKETGGGGQAGGRIEPIIVTVMDEPGDSMESSQEVTQEAKEIEEKTESSDESLAEEKVPETPEEPQLRKETVIETRPVREQTPQKAEKKEEVKETLEEREIASLENAQESSVTEGNTASTEGEDSLEAPDTNTAANLSDEVALNLNHGASPNYGLNPKPPYPKSARRRGYEGTVLLRVLVTEDGKVGDIKVSKPSGHTVLDESALKAVKKWTFIPGKKAGKDVSSWVEVPIKYQLDSG